MSDSNKKLRHIEESGSDIKNKSLTTDQGTAIEDTDNSLKAGERGPIIMDDFHFREKMTHFDHERIPERVVHARGSAAHGYFQVYESMKKYTKAKFLQDPSKKTPVFVRFSTVVGFRGSADTVRDVRGFATKFYTEEGNYDLVGNNIPVFFIQDAIKFPDLVHSIKPEPHHEMPQATAAHDNFWDFVSLTPESTHMLLWVLSDRGIPKSYSTMEGFGVHTFRWINSEGKSTFVKYHWKPLAGIHSLAWDEAQKIAGKDPDFNRRDLYESIEAGNDFEYELGVQLFSEEEAAKFDFDVLDPTKIVPEELVPVKKIGKMVLNRNPDNFFMETEQVAFHPGNLVPGIDLSNDPLLQGRLFSYLDTQLTRLGGPNFAQIPINRPLPEVITNQQDGFMRMSNMKGRVNYFPSSMDGGGVQMTSEKDGGYRHYPEKTAGIKTRQRSDTFDDHYSQAILFYNSMSEVEKKHILEAASFELGKVEAKHVRERMVMNFMNVDQKFANELAKKIGVEAKNPEKPHQYRGKIKDSPALSQLRNKTKSLKGRTVAVLIEEGFNSDEVKTLEKKLKAEGVMMKIVSFKLGEVKGQKHKDFEATYTFSTTHSVLFDGIFIPGGTDSCKGLADHPKVMNFLEEAFRHNKPIALSSEAKMIFDKSRLPLHMKSLDDQASSLFEEHGFLYASSKVKNDDLMKSFLSALSEHRFWEREGEKLPG